jgi:alpha,alpha-trehalose phosphorylase
VIDHPAFECEPWALTEHGLDLDLLPHTESLFALSNGHIGWRGNLDEGEPHGLPGSYLNGVYEVRPLPYAEAGYGFPEVGQSVINVTNGKLIRLLVDDEPFDVRYGKLHSHERTLDLRDGVLRRSVEWESPAGRTVRVRTTRMVSLTQRAIAAVFFEVEPVDAAARVVVQSELVANEEMPMATTDPRAAAALASPLNGDVHGHNGTRVGMVHTVKQSGLRVASAMDHMVDGPDNLLTETESRSDVGRFTAAALLQPGEKLRLVKFVAYGWSAERSLPAMRDQVEAALSAARQTGWEKLLADQRETLDDYWARADVEIDGDDEIQQAVRFALFHIHQSAARAEQRAIPAKGLTGNGYDGHAFWDTETFVLQVLTYTAPDAAADALRWRQHTLPAARAHAEQLCVNGAAFAWRTIAGEECSGYWPAGTAAFHINADIADAVVRYLLATGDSAFDREVALELLVETARLWCSLGHFDDTGRFRIEGVTGPDEYSAIADNNVYTNLMAQQNLAAAADAVGRYPDAAAKLGVDTDETERWRAAAKGMYVPYDVARGVHPQADGFTQHAVWDFEDTPEDKYPLLLHYPYFQLYRKQVVKQADLVLALHLRGDVFREEEKARDFAYYERLTVRDSSLSACSQAVVAAELGHMTLAYDYLGEAALMDLDNLEHNTADGLHLASLAGSWIALVAGFGGMRHQERGLSFAPRLPSGWNKLSFRVMVRGAVLRVEADRDIARYTLESGQDLEILHHGTALTLTAGEPVSRALPKLPDHPAPTQPHGRSPRPRTAEGASRFGSLHYGATRTDS